LASVARLVLPYFSKFSQTALFSGDGGRKFVNIRWVSIFFTTSVWNVSHSNRHSSWYYICT